MDWQGLDAGLKTRVVGENWIIFARQDSDFEANAIVAMGMEREVIALWVLWN